MMPPLSFLDSFCFLALKHYDVLRKGKGGGGGRLEFLDVGVCN